MSDMEESKEPPKGKRHIPHRGRRSYPPAPPVTAEMAGKMKTMLNSGLPQQQIAAFFGVNSGRVSEVNTGKKFPDVPPLSL